MTEFRPNPLFQAGVVSTNGDGLSIDQVSPLFKEHREAVASAQSEVAVAKAEAQKAKDAAEAAARLAEQARQDAETKAAQAATLESEVRVMEDRSFAEGVANTEKIIEETYGIELKTEAEEEPKPKTTRARKATEPTE
jgi:hypothetical protein